MSVCVLGREHNASFHSQPDVSDDSFDFNVNNVHATCFSFVLYKLPKKYKNEKHLENHPSCICLWNVTLTFKSHIGANGKGTSE